jgi:glyoxylase-like metal-dependent hydrolase (beta-lactamase superfamily II)
MSLAALAALWLATMTVEAGPALPPARFEKLTDHYFFFQPVGGGWNVGAVITDEGVLLVDPPAETDLPAVQEALKKATPKAVRWVVHTDFRREVEGTGAQFARQGAVVLESRDLSRLLSEAGKPAESPASAAKDDKAEEKRPGVSRNPRLIFEHQMRLFPAGVEVKILALQHKGRTGGDVVVILPAEKALQTGDFYWPSSLPGIDVKAGGSAAGWIDGLKQVVDAVPVLKAAIPQPKSEPPQRAGTKPAAKPGEVAKMPEEEKSLEELIVVVPGHGPASNLMEMKELLESAQKLRNEIARGKGRLNVKTSGVLAPYRSLPNFEGFATLLSEELFRAR